jgi:5-methylcytosine-specific restriction protein A
VRDGVCTVCGPEVEAQAYDRRRGTAAQRGYGARWQKRRGIFLRQHPLCAQCSAPATDVDHITPKRQGGSDDESNLQPLCATCHSRKTNREMRGTRVQG